MPATYEPIATYTLSSAIAEITFSNIPSTYTDLFVVAQVPNANNSGGLRWRVNGDTSGNYSYTVLEGTGASAISQRGANDTAGATSWSSSMSTTNGVVATIHLFSYSNTNVFKSALATASSPNVLVSRVVNLWRSTASISSLTLGAGGGFPTAMTFSIGSTFSLYGIRSA